VVRYCVTPISFFPFKAWSPGQVRARLALFLAAALFGWPSLSEVPSASGAAAAESKLTGEMRTAHFVVRYDPKDPFLAKLMAETADDELKRIAHDLGYHAPRDRPFPLFVYPTHIGFIEAGGLETSKFTVGTASGGVENISVDASGAFAPPEQVLAHEITHAVIFRLLGAAAVELPLWMNEGLAKYESREPPGEDDELVGSAAAEGSLMSLSRLASDFPEKRNALAYAESYSAARFLVKRHGRKAPRALLAALARTGSFDKAMLEATGRTGDAFADEWLADTTKQYWALRLARVGTAVISAVMAALAVVAFLVRRRQKIEAARRWEQEELERRYRGYAWPSDEE